MITSAQIDRKIKPVLREMENVGIKIDVEILNRLSLKLKAQSSKLAGEIQKLAGREFNLLSPSQLADVLFNELKLPTTDIRRNKSGMSTGASELEKLKAEHKIIKSILKFRELSKLLSTYLRPLPALVDENSRLHTHFGQDARTGRLTSSEPNLQNIPIKGEFGPEIRRAFIADRGNKLIVADYSQIELRVIASLSADQAMIEAFDNGIDIHARTAAEIFSLPISKISKDQRRVAKVVNFGIIYGISPYGLAQSLGIEQAKAAEYIFRYFDKHSGIKKYCQASIEFAKKNGYVETLFGFRRKLPEINSPVRGLAETAQRMAVNTPVQGTAAEILKLSMIRLADQLKVQNQRSNLLPAGRHGKNQNYGKLILTVHDELIVEVKASEAKKIAKIVRETMENIVKLSVPLSVEVGIGDNWDQAKENSKIKDQIAK